MSKLVNIVVKTPKLAINIEKGYLLEKSVA